MNDQYVIWVGVPDSCSGEYSLDIYGIEGKAHVSSRDGFLFIRGIRADGYVEDMIAYRVYLRCTEGLDSIRGDVLRSMRPVRISEVYGPSIDFEDYVEKVMSAVIQVIKNDTTQISRMAEATDDTKHLKDLLQMDVSTIRTFVEGLENRISESGRETMLRDIAVAESFLRSLNVFF